MEKNEMLKLVLSIGLSGLAGDITAEIINDLLGKATSLDIDQLAKVGEGMGKVGGEIVNPIINANDLVGGLLELSGVADGVFENVGAVIHFLAKSVNLLTYYLNSAAYDINSFDFIGLAKNPVFMSTVWFISLGLIIRKMKKNKIKKSKMVVLR